MAREAALYVEHEIKYTNELAIPVRDVVEALLALEAISGRFLPRTLNALLDVEIKRADILVEGIEHGSLTEKVLIKFVFGSEEQMDSFLDKMHDGKIKDAAVVLWQGLPGGPKVKIGAIGILLAALIGYGIHYALPEGKDPGQVNFIVIGAEAYGRDPENFADIVRTAIGSDKKKLAQATANFIAPAKNDPNGAVVLDNNQALHIPADTVRAMPREVAKEPYETNIEYKDVDLELRATDRDYPGRGWAGVVRDLFDHRVKVVLDEGISTSELAGKFHVRADVWVTSRVDSRTSQLKVAQVRVSRIIQDGDE